MIWLILVAGVGVLGLLYLWFTLFPGRVAPDIYLFQRGAGGKRRQYSRAIRLAYIFRFLPRPPFWSGSFSLGGLWRWSAGWNKQQGVVFGPTFCCFSWRSGFSAANQPALYPFQQLLLAALVGFFSTDNGVLVDGLY